MRRVRNMVIAALPVLALAAAPVAAQVAVRGATVHTMAGPPIRDGVVIVRDGRIAAVGPASEIEIPGDLELLEAAVVTPGLIDAHSVVGIAGQYNYEHDQDQLERSTAIQPALRAIDAYNARERLVEWVRSFGVTTVHTGHAPGELVSGQTLIARTAGETVDEAVVVPVFAVAATLSEAALKDGEKSPGTRGKMMSLLRQKFLDAREYRDRRAREQAAGAGGAGDGDGDGDDDAPRGRDLDLEVLVQVLEGELPILITAHRAHDIASALRLADEFDLRLILDGASEAYLLMDALAAAKVPVIIHPTMMRAYGEAENMSFETAAKLVDAGIPVALQSGYEDYVPKTRVVLFEAAWAAANGLGFERALRTITIDAARILEIDDQVGSLEAGKRGDIALYDGDPFEYTSHCTGVVIGGEVVSRQTR